MATEGRSSGAGVGGLARRSKRNVSNPASIIRHGHMSEADAELVWTNLLQAWQINSSTESMREDILQALAESAAYGTSAAMDFDATAIVVDGVRLVLSAVTDAAKAYTTQPNPARVWYRSFRRAEIPCRTFELLSNPMNEALRIDVAMRYGCSAEAVKFAFDMFADAVAYLPAGMQLVAMGRAVSRGYLAENRADVQARGVNSALHDTANRQADGAAASVVTAPTHIPQSQGERLSLNTIRRM